LVSVGVRGKAQLSTEEYPMGHVWQHGVPISVLARCIQKVILDTTGFVHLRNPLDAGGFYYCLNALMTHVACFVAAALYSAYSTGDAVDDKSYSATVGNHNGANATNATVASITATRLADGTGTDYAGKIDTFTLFAFTVTLSAVWSSRLPAPPVVCHYPPFF
jgi:hypothetical protein